MWVSIAYIHGTQTVWAGDFFVSSWLLAGRGRFPWLCSKMEIGKSFILLIFLLLLGVSKHCCKTWVICVQILPKDSRHALLGNHERSLFQERFTEWLSYTEPQIFHVTQVVRPKKKMMDRNFSLQMVPHMSPENWWLELMYMYFPIKKMVPFSGDIPSFFFGGGHNKNQAIQLQNQANGRVDGLNPCKRWA